MRRALLVLISVLPTTAIAQAPPGGPGDPGDPAPLPDDAPTTPDLGAPVGPVAPEPATAPAPPLPSTTDTNQPLPPPAGWRLMLSDLSVLRLNPLGLETRARLGLQKRLYASDKAITQNNFMFAGVYPKLNPVSAHLAIGGELQPASIFNVRATVEVQKYFGILGYLQSFTSPTANYSDQTLKDLRDVPAFEPQTSTVFHASIQPLLQVKVGPVAVRALFQFDYWSLGLRTGDNAAYEATFDTLLPDDGWTISTDTDVLYTGRPRLALGVRHTWVKPFYKERHFAGAADAAAYDESNAHQRLGLFGAYTLRDDGPSKFNKPTLILIVSWYLSHRWRTGETTGDVSGMTRPDDFTSRAFPYLLAGFAFESDFLPVR